MKNILIVLVFAFVLAGCQSNIDVEDASSVLPVTSLPASIDEVQNDLVYHDYGTGIYLTANAIVAISLLDLKSSENYSTMYAIKLDTNEVISLDVYQPSSSITFTPKEDGYYRFISITGKNDIIDITPSVTFETTYEIESNNGFLPLK
jgi:uncharacterized protein YceK